MAKIPCLLLLLWLSLSVLYGQEVKDTLRFRIVSYNVENLFDCKHDSLKNDYEFLPEARRHWNYPKYRRKLDNVARTIIAVGEWMPPALVALCEVENDSVLRDLTRYSVLRKAGYHYVMTNSPDERGIDVALLYQRHLFKLLHYSSIRVSDPQGRRHPTRDILHVSGMLLNRDTLDLFVVHFPSRAGGAKASESYRLLAARRLKAAADSVAQVRLRPQLLILGDFNDYPHNRSIRQVLQAATPPPDSLQPSKLYHLLARRTDTQRNFGSYKYQGSWGLLDHIIVSGSLLQADSPLHTDEAHADVFRAPFLLTEDRKYGGDQPFRTYYGMKYQAGYSDHLPVWAEFRLLY